MCVSVEVKAGPHARVFDLRPTYAAPGRYEAVFIEFIHIRMDVLIATDFCTSEVQSCSELVIASLQMCEQRIHAPRVVRSRDSS
jgi:hypothetical protein